VGKDRVEWYDIHYWIRRFGLNVKAEELLRSFEHKIRPYPEVPKVLDRLRQRGFRLIVVTNAGREFAELELEKANIKKYFNRVFSSTSDFVVVKKTVKLYQTVCKMLEASPQEIVHIGDDWKFDFHVPNMLGILAFYLDRTGKQQGEFVIHSLEELDKKLEKVQAEHL